MVLINPITIVYVPYEIRPGGDVKRDDLPRFQNPEEVREFMAREPAIHIRRGLSVHLEWREHDEDWALAEYHRGVGRQLWRM